MRTLWDIAPPDKIETHYEAGVPVGRTLDAEWSAVRIVAAYAAVFSGNGTSEDVDLVLVDLAQFTRYYDTAALDAPADQVKALDQRRAVFQRIMEALTKSGKPVEGLHSAVLRAPLVE